MLLLALTGFVKASVLVAYGYLTTASVVILAAALHRKELLGSSFIEWKQGE